MIETKDFNIFDIFCHILGHKKFAKLMQDIISNRLYFLFNFLIHILLHKPIGTSKLKSQFNATITFHLDKSILTSLQLPRSPRIPECDVGAAIGSPFIPLSHAWKAQHEQVHYLDIVLPFLHSPCAQLRDVQKQKLHWKPKPCSQGCV